MRQCERAVVHAKCGSLLGKYMAMKRAVLLIAIVAFAGVSLAAKNESGGQTKATGSKASTQPATAASGGSAALEKALDAMDRTAANFTSAQADFETDQYQKVVDDHDLQKGVMYIRKAGKDLEMAADINEPPAEQKKVLFADGKVQLYQPKIDQVTQYSAGKNKEAFQSFLVLGFGSRGHDLVQQFDVRYGGTEKVGGADTIKLELTPKSSRVRAMFNLIVLWIDPARGVSVQQQFFEPESGNYRLAKYSNIKLNQKPPEGEFKLKTTSRTKYVTPGI